MQRRRCACSSVLPIHFAEDIAQDSRGIPAKAAVRGGALTQFDGKLTGQQSLQYFL